ncbi:hypothetical protein Gbro_1427 [Gordonia bronchialis DSM 43247]|uniref:Uncharacterized protein n=1 Tax=Gordonia bronchialis (strain ATCC 25592 / DSM 43247 / BCRC 13721 / JCM 3198 / KCTC 3076 / NBRC 16047 / NCTC 10667) TaxID=526226 RepID=D0L6F2_GORB4|nr:hypothetical protein [Gordonia bronchialis]ACY20709.1 hypothetical protein Gbro_1427 [Gordonia bronchialis DSM 43247]MCC3323482.1 hypothetical protein [Gordonia bronchialis]QGS25539.1 hypothetical protein FOB84_16740 [Gordonia bronchialis]STQ63538.1 Uncharacterised protein [Gordonia bronchialis]
MRLELLLVRLQRRLDRVDRWIAARWHCLVARVVIGSVLADRDRAQVDREVAIRAEGGPAVVVYAIQDLVVLEVAEVPVADLSPRQAYALATELAHHADIAEGAT